MRGELREEKVESRYYHLRLVNEKRLNVAREAQIVITSIEEKGPDGRPRGAYTVPLPLSWQYQHLLDPSPHRTVGAQAYIADLLFVRDDGLFLTPIFMPNNFPGRFDKAVIFWITLQARSIETESLPLRLQISWDGKWERGEAEMAKHLVIEPV